MKKKEKEECFPQHGGMYKTSNVFGTDPYDDCRHEDLWYSVKPMRNYICRFWYKHIGDIYGDWVDVLKTNLSEKFNVNLDKIMWYMRDGIELYPISDPSHYYEYFNIDDNGCVIPGECTVYDDSVGKKHGPLYIWDNDGNMYEVTAHRKSKFYKQCRAEEKDARRKIRRENKKAKEEKEVSLLRSIEEKRERQLRDENFQKIIKHGFDPLTSFRK